MSVIFYPCALGLAACVGELVIWVWSCLSTVTRLVIIILHKWHLVYFWRDFQSQTVFDNLIYSVSLSSA